MDRWVPIKAKTFCYVDLNTNEVAINDFFWHLEGLLNDAQIRSTAARPPDHISTLFDYGLDQGNRKDTFIKDFIKINQDNSNFFRLFSLVACASYLEHYLSQSFKLSLYSNIGVIFGQPHTLDGIKVLKSQASFPFQTILKSLIEGKWKTRNVRINTLFGVKIDAIQRNLVMLEWLRLTRNAVAHQFGLEGDIRFIEQVDASYFTKSNIIVPTIKVKETLKIIREVVDEVEMKISGPNIGVFEMLLFIHNFKNNVDDFQAKMPAKYKNATLEKMLSIFSRDAGLQNVSRVDARELIKFYNNS